MGFGWSGSHCQGSGVGLQRPGDRALPAADQAQLSQPVASLARCRCGAFVTASARAASLSPLAQQQGAEVQLRAKLQRGSSAGSRAWR